jgi:hypothetical protein
MSWDDLFSINRFYRDQSVLKSSGRLRQCGVIE